MIAPIDAEAFDPASIVPNLGYLWVRHLATEGDYEKCEVVATPYATTAISVGTVVYSLAGHFAAYPNHRSGYGFLRVDEILGYRRKLPGDERS